MNSGVQAAAYIAAAILFIKSLGGLSHQESANKGNWYGILGMTVAIVATLLGPGIQGLGYLLGAFAIAAIIGIYLAVKVEMTQMPQLVAALHSFVGLAAILVGYDSFFHAGSHTGAALYIHSIEVYLGVFIGAITFTGSILAFLKLQGSIGGSPFLYPGRHIVNILIVVVSIYLGYVFTTGSQDVALNSLFIMTALASVLGVLLVAAIGGADMPVVVSMLNSYSGWAAAAAGFMLSNDLLIITGALVGSSGAILSYIMCEAMNRSFFSVIFGGFGTVNSSSSTGTDELVGDIISTDKDEVTDLLCNAKSVIIVPGYGMAVAKAQYPIHEMTKKLQDKGIDVRFAIHPVAGRLPGHMNVLLAEANVSYDIVLEMDEVNDDIHTVDVEIGRAHV